MSAVSPEKIDQYSHDVAMLAAQAAKETALTNAHMGVAGTPAATAAAVVDAYVAASTRVRTVLKAD